MLLKVSLLFFLIVPVELSISESAIEIWRCPLNIVVSPLINSTMSSHVNHLWYRSQLSLFQQWNPFPPLFHSSSFQGLLSSSFLCPLLRTLPTLSIPSPIVFPTLPPSLLTTTPPNSSWEKIRALSPDSGVNANQTPRPFTTQSGRSFI